MSAPIEEWLLGGSMLHHRVYEHGNGTGSRTHGGETASAGAFGAPVLFFFAPVSEELAAFSWAPRERVRRHLVFQALQRSDLLRQPAGLHRVRVGFRGIRFCEVEGLRAAQDPDGERSAHE